MNNKKSIKQSRTCMMANWSRVRWGKATISEPGLGNPRRCCVFQAPSFHSESLFLFCACPLLNMLDTRLSCLLSQLLLETLLADKSVTSRWHLNLQKQHKNKNQWCLLQRICNFCVLFLNWGKRRRKERWREYFPFTFEKLSGSASSEEQSWVFSGWQGWEYKICNFCD